MRRTHLEPDHKHKHHDPELGHVQDALWIGEPAEPERPDQEPGGQITEHGAKAQFAKNGHHEDRGAEQRHDLDQLITIGLCVHRGPERLRRRGVRGSLLLSRGGSCLSCALPLITGTCYGS